MNRTPMILKINEIRSLFADIEFPEYQREPNIWSREQKQRLIDSILRKFDISSIYFYERGDGVFECIDGRQRITAIMSFLGDNEDDEVDNGFPLRIQSEISSTSAEYDELNHKHFQEMQDADDELSKAAVKEILGYEVQVSILSDSHTPDEFNLQFLRLNLGTLINAGEKLHAMVGSMHDLIFHSSRIGHHPFFAELQIPTRRYAKEQVAAQVVLQVFSYETDGTFGRARYLDLQKFLKDYASIDEQDARILRIAELLDHLYRLFDERHDLLRNRAIVVSVVLLAWSRSLPDDPETSVRFVEFVAAFMQRLAWQIAKMKDFDPDQRYGYLMEFQRHVTQASVEKPAVAARHRILVEELDHWLANNELSGDAEFKGEHGYLPGER